MGDEQPTRRGTRRHHPPQRGGRPSLAGAVTRMVPVKSVGKLAERHYCPRCGLRWKLCACSDQS